MTVKNNHNNQHDDDAKPHGYWEQYYSNKNLFTKGNYIHGNYDGYWEQYHNNGKLAITANFNNGKPNGYWEYFDYCIGNKYYPISKQIYYL